MATLNIKISNLSPSTLLIGVYSIPVGGSITTDVDPVKDSLWSEVQLALFKNKISVYVNTISDVSITSSISVKTLNTPLLGQTLWDI